MGRNKKVALVTGSSRGIGRSIATELLKEGYCVILNGRDKYKLERTENELRIYSPEIYSIECDISDANKAAQMITSIVNDHGSLDVVINNVGVSMRGDVAELDPAVFQKVFLNNVIATMNVSIPSLQQIKKTKGSLIFISSVAGIRGLPGLSAYSASKMALSAIADSLRLEEKHSGIHVGLILVGKTEIDEGKITLMKDGTESPLRSRAKERVDSTEVVAKKVIRNLQKRRSTTVLSPLGHALYYLQRLSPALTQLILLTFIHRFREGSK